MLLSSGSDYETLLGMLHYLLFVAIEAKGYVLNKPFISRREVGGSRNGFRIFRIAILGIDRVGSLFLEPGA